MSAENSMTKAVMEIGAALLILAAWGVYSTIYPSLYFPALTQILSAFSDNWLFDRALSDVMPSLFRMVAGYMVGCLIGILVGIWLGMSPGTLRAFDPVMQFLRSIPPPALLPLGMLTLGIGDMMKIVIIGFVCVWPVMLSAIDGVRGVDTVQLDTAKMFNISRFDTLRSVIVPAASPQILAGMRVSLSFAIILMVISEMVSSTNGIGFFIIQAQSSFAIPDMWSGILLLGLMGYFLNAVFGGIEARLLGWHRGAKRNERT